MSIELIVVGASLGGLDTLELILPGLPPELPAPVVIAQHRLADNDSRLAELLQNHCALPVVEPDDGESIRAGRVYLAPPDYHLLVEQGTFALSTEAPVNFARPSIDVLFESAADAYDHRVLGLVLTGASDDGVAGALAIKRRGGVVLVQEPETALSQVAPRAVVARVRIDEVVPLDRITSRLCALCSVSPLPRSRPKP